MDNSTKRSIKNIGKSMNIYANKGNGKYYKEYKENKTFHYTWKDEVLYDFFANIISTFFISLLFLPIAIGCLVGGFIEIFFDLKKI